VTVLRNFGRGWKGDFLIVETTVVVIETGAKIEIDPHRSKNWGKDA
jgi:hypothetical protein